MTLIVTAVSHLGIVMVADSAETCSLQNKVRYVRTGVRKVIPVRQIDAGISMWGQGEVKGFPMDLWVENFVANNVTSEWTLRQLCDALAKALNDEGIFPGVNGDIIGGFHLAGYEDFGAGELPSAYHVHNKHPHEMPHELIVYHDFPVGIYQNNLTKYYNDMSSGSLDWHVRNGAFENFIYVWDAIAGQSNPLQQSVLSRLKLNGVKCPFPDTLAERARFYSFLVEVVARLFSMSNAIEIISMPLSVLTINKDGIQDYQPALRRAANTMSLS